MTHYVLDTSVAIAWYVPEAFSESARYWQRQCHDGNIRILIPQLHRFEFGNVLRTQLKRKTLTPTLAEEIYQVHLEAPFICVDPRPANLLTTALEYDATLYDAVYIQLALEHDVSLLTAERGNRGWVRKLGSRAVKIT